MKKLFLIILTLLTVIITTSCTDLNQNTYTITIENGIFKGEDVSTKTLSYKDIIVIVPNESEQNFIGWYEGEKLLSEKEEYTLQVEKNITITAKFTTQTKLKNGYYLLTKKTEKGLDITKNYVFNALLIENDKVTWQEVDYTGSKELTGTVNITADTVELNIGIKKYIFTPNENYTTLSFNNKIDRIQTTMTYTYEKDYQMKNETGNVKLTDELFGDDITQNFYNYCPSIMIENGNTMHIWYCSNKESGIITDYVAYRKGTLTNDGKWTYSEKEYVLAPTKGTWDQVHVCDPSVVKGNFKYNNEEYSYLMAYLGCNTYNCTINEVGIAVSKTPNGPFIKIDEINPIANFKQAIEEHDNSTEWKNSWGYGQPSLVSIDKMGKVMLFYTAGTPKSTHTIAEEWDLTNLNQPTKLSSVELSSIGVTNASGGVDCINNADFAYDPVSKHLICVKEDSPYATNGNVDWITGSNTLLYMELDQDETSPMHTIITNKTKSWVSFSKITKSTTGYERNHNMGLITDEYGWVLNSTKIGVVYTMSMLVTDYPNWSLGGQWPALHTYRLHGLIVDLP